jgi:hypothetical protein
MLFKNVLALSVAGLVGFASLAAARDFAFFNILKDGKADKEAIAKHCSESDGWVRAFSSASVNLLQTQANQRISFKGQQFTNSNASPGEWSMELYKTLCPGLYTFNVDFVTAQKDGSTNGDVTVQLYAWKKDAKGPRPGTVVAEAVKVGKGRGAGHATATLAMGTGDEITAFAVSADGKPVYFERVQLNAHRAHHMPQFAADFDSIWWEEDRAVADKITTLPAAPAK